jgi:hypothetical protein
MEAETRSEAGLRPRVAWRRRGEALWWTELAANELAALIQFSSVLSALACAHAPLDLIGMTSDFEHSP